MPDHSDIEFVNEIACPHCGHTETVRMNALGKMAMFRCPGCGAALHPIEGDCCVCCSFGSVPCPSVQLAFPPPAHAPVKRF